MNVDFTSSQGKRNCFKSDSETKAKMSLKPAYLVEQAEQAIALGLSLAVAYAATSTGSTSREGHPAGTLLARGITSAATIRAILREVGSAVVVLAEDADGGLHPLRDVLDAQQPVNAHAAARLAGLRRLGSW